MVHTNQKLKLGPMSVDNLITHLTIDQVKMIDEAISTIGDFGEVRLVIERGKLHYLVTQKSVNVRSGKLNQITK
jgi:hypothetical protein